MKRRTILIILSYLTIYIVWGSTYFFIKMAVATISPWSVVGLRWFLGGLAFLVFTYCTGRLRTWPTWREVLASLLLGFILILGGNGLISIAEQRVDSYLVALILASTPMVVAFFDRLFFKKRVAPICLAGIILGTIGVALLLYDGRSPVSSLSLQIILVLVGLTCWSFGTSIGSSIRVHKDVFVNSGIQMLLTGMISLVIVAVTQPGSLNFLATCSQASLLGLLYLTVFGSVAFAAYNYLIAQEPALRVVSYAFVNPLIAVLLGLVIGKESVVAYLWLGFPVIIIGLFLMIYGEPLRKLLLNKIAGQSQ